MDNKIILLKKKLNKNLSIKINYNYDRYVAEAIVYVDNGDGSTTRHKLLFDIPGIHD